MPGGPALRSALLHAAARFLTSNARSRSPVVLRVAAARDALAVDAALEGDIASLEARCGRCASAGGMRIIIVTGCWSCGVRSWHTCAACC